MIQEALLRRTKHGDKASFPILPGWLVSDPDPVKQRHFMASC